MAARARYKRVRTQNKLGMVLTMVVVLLLFTAISMRSLTLRDKRDQNRARIEYLESQIAMEEERGEEIASFEKYTHTRKYVEQIAKSKLGLVYPGEIIFKEQQ